MAIDFQSSYYNVQWDLNIGILNKEMLDAHRFGSVDDNANGFKLRVLQNGAILTPTTEDVYFYAEKPDSKLIYIKAAKSGDYFIINLTNQVFAVPGPVMSNFRIEGGTNRRTSETFRVNVDSNNVNDQIESQDDCVAFVEALGSMADTITLVNEVLPIMQQALVDEPTRISNEIARQNQESDRQDNETDRQSNTNTAINNCNIATGNANQATANANTATGDAIQATLNANTAAEDTINAILIANSAAERINMALTDYEVYEYDMDGGGAVDEVDYVDANGGGALTIT